MSKPAKPPLPPPAPSDSGDSRLESFLHKAAPIIAKERGINARSRILLESVARDMKLPSELFDQGLHMLQGAPPVAKKERSRWQKAFAVYVRRRFKKSPQGILNVEMESRALDKGQNKYGLSEAEAREVIDDVAQSLDLHRISLSEAERFVTEMIEKKVGEAEWLDDRTITRLRAAGVGWGLKVEQVDALIRDFTDANRRRQEKEQNTSLVFITLAAVILVALLLVFAGVVLFRDHSDPDATAGADVEGTGNDPTLPPSEKVEPLIIPDWWTDELKRAAVQMVNRPTVQSLYRQIAAKDTSARGAGYENVVELAKNEWSSLGKLRPALARLCSQAYAVEPDDEAAGRLSDALLNLAVTRNDKIPSSAAEYERGIWAVEAAVDALHVDGIPDGRANAMEIALSRRVGTAVDRKHERLILRKQCLTGLTRMYYAQLIAHSKDDPFLVAELHASLSKRVSKFVEPEEHNRLDANYLNVILLTDNRLWRRYQESGVIRYCLESDDPLIAIKLVEVLENSTDRTLRNYLMDQFSVVHGMKPSLDVKQFAGAIRKKLGITTTAPTGTASDRWKLLEKAMAGKVDRPPAPGNPYKLLHETVEVAHLATLACAVAQQESGLPIFDKLNEEGPPKLSGKAAKKKSGDDDGPFRESGPGGDVPMILAMRRNKVRGHVDSLRRFRDLASVDRLSALRGLSRLATLVDSLEAKQAQVIATYLLAVKSEARTRPSSTSEQERLLEIVPDLAPWREIKLAIADQLTGTDLRQFQVQKLLTALLQRKVEFDEDEWRDASRELLLRSVLTDLKSAPIASKSDPDLIYDRAAAAIHELYKMRASLLGMPPGNIESTSSVAELLRRLIDAGGARLSGSANNKTSDGRFLLDLPHRLRAVDYLGDNDIRRAVLLQRVYLRLLAIDMKRRRAAQAGAAATLVDELLDRDVKARDLLVQLWDGEATSLKLWMLYGR